MLNDLNDLISGIEKVREALQRRASFHDGEIVSILLDRVGPSLTISVWLRQYSYDGGEFRPVQDYLATLRFEDIEGLEIDDFNHQNVIQELVTEQAGDKLRVRFATLFGADVSFICSRAHVVEVVNYP